MEETNVRWVKGIKVKELSEEEEAARKERQEREEKWLKKREEEQARLNSPLGQIEILEREANEKLQKADNIRKLAELYPDLKRYVGRWDKESWCSKSINDKVTEIDMRHNCGCCSDSPLEIWPYMVTNYGNVYSDPSKFIVGEQHWISGDKPYDNWKKSFRDVGISEEIIKKVSEHFKKCAEEREALGKASPYEDEE